MRDWLFRIIRELVCIALCSRVDCVLRMSMKYFPREWGTGSSGWSENWCVLHCIPELSVCPENEYEEFPPIMRDWLFRIIRELVCIALYSRVECVSWEWVWSISPDNKGLALQDHQRTGVYCTMFQSWLCPENEYEEFPQRMRDWLFRIMRELVSIALYSRVEWVSREWVWRISPENEGLALQDHERTGEYCTVFQSWVSVQRMSMKNFPREWGTGSSGSWENWWVLHCIPELSDCPENEYEEFPPRLRDRLFRMIREQVSIALCSRVEWVSREWVWRISPEIEGPALQDHARTGEYCTVFQSWVSVQRMSMKNFPREWGTGSSGSCENWWVLHCVPELSECPENEYEEFPQRMRDRLFRIMRELVSIALCSRVEWLSREWVWRISPENEGLALQDHERTAEYCTVFQSWVSVKRMSTMNFLREWGTGSSGSCENSWVLGCMYSALEGNVFETWQMLAIHFFVHFDILNEQFDFITWRQLFSGVMSCNKNHMTTNHNTLVYWRVTSCWAFYCIFFFNF